MIKSVIIRKYRHGRQGPSLRTLRRALRPERVTFRLRMVIFLALLSLVFGVIGVFTNTGIAHLEREHASGPQHRD